MAPSAGFDWQVYFAADGSGESDDGNFTADYVVRRAKEVRTHWKGLVRLSGIMAITVGLIIAEPDLGATVVIVLMMVGIFFLQARRNSVCHYARCNIDGNWFPDRI
jgi:hypothetical protein